MQVHRQKLDEDSRHQLSLGPADSPVNLNLGCLAGIYGSLASDAIPTSGDLQLTARQEVSVTQYSLQYNDGTAHASPSRT
jgi:hypothetical protein